jgi:hypothetical protein
MGGQLQIPTTPQTRWYLAQLEAAEVAADGGIIEGAGLLMRAARTDGVFAGVLSTRTAGLVRLPKYFRGDKEVVADLELGHEATGSTFSVFDEMFPPGELAMLAADGVCLGVGVGELVPVDGRDFPLFVRLEPQWLVYRWIENRWYYRSVAGLLPITPGDGRWILHTPGGRMSPWAGGIWRAVGRAYIRKTHAALQKDNWEGKLANPARVAVSPHGAGEAQQEAWFRQVMAWGINTTFGLRPGYDCKLIESNGRGWESFNTTIDQQNQEMILSVTGQTVTVDGGAGFQNGDVFKSIRADLIKATADDLAHTINTQGIPAYVLGVYGEDAVDEKICVMWWDVTPPKDRTAEAQSLLTAAQAITALQTALAPNAVALDVAAMCSRFGIPVKDDKDQDGVSDTPQLGAGDESADGAIEGGAENVADTAMNGAQVSSLLEVLGQAAANQIPRSTAVEMIIDAYRMPRDRAEAIVGEIGRGFVPTSTAVDVAPIEPVDEDAGGDELELEPLDGEDDALPEAAE